MKLKKNVKNRVGVDTNCRLSLWDSPQWHGKETVEKEIRGRPEETCSHSEFSKEHLLQFVW